MLCKVRKFVIERTLISIYHVIFDSHLNYASIVWGQTKSKVKSFNTKSHGKEAVIYSAINTWNSLQKQLKHFLLSNLSTFQLKNFLKHLKTYQH